MALTTRLGWQPGIASGEMKKGASKGGKRNGIVRVDNIFVSRGWIAFGESPILAFSLNYCRYLKPGQVNGGSQHRERGKVPPPTHRINGFIATMSASGSPQRIIFPEK